MLFCPNLKNIIKMWIKQLRNDRKKERIGLTKVLPCELSKYNLFFADIAHLFFVFRSAFVIVFSSYIVYTLPCCFILHYYTMLCVIPLRWDAPLLQISCLCFCSIFFTSLSVTTYPIFQLYISIPVKRVGKKWGETRIHMCLVQFIYWTQTFIFPCIIKTYYEDYLKVV